MSNIFGGAKPRRETLATLSASNRRPGDDGRILTEALLLAEPQDEAVAAFIDHDRRHRYHESLGDLNPAGAYLGKAEI